jgi:sorting nexin-8
MPSSIPAFTRGDFDELLWIYKYAPATAEHVLQVGPEALILRDWLRNLVVSTVRTGSQDRDSPKPKHRKDGISRRNKRRKKAEDLEDFIVTGSDDSSQMDELSNSDDDELAGGVTVSSKRTVVRPGNLTTGVRSEKRPVANSVLISGPSGCGKTASVYAVAKELGFEVFEINSGTRRSARDVVERVGDMTQNHLVHLLKQIEKATAGGSHEPGPSDAKAGTEKQRRANGFFQQYPTTGCRRKAKATISQASETEELVPKCQRSQKQSLILLEEVDVLFEEDKQFWNGILALISQSKRPIIMTCNDENLLPLDELEFHAILRFRQPPYCLAADYILLLCANEGHVLDRKEISDLYVVLHRDLRATIMQLNIWCQMAVGSKKSGLDWMADRQPLPSALEARATLPRVISFNTYVQGIDWLSRDIALEEKDPLEREVQLMMECLDQWHVGVADWQETKVSTSETLDFHGTWDRFEALKHESQAADLRSILDVICQAGSGDLTKVTPPPDFCKDGLQP